MVLRLKSTYTFHLNISCMSYTFCISFSCNSVLLSGCSVLHGGNPIFFIEIQYLWNISSKRWGLSWFSPWTVSVNQLVQHFLGHVCWWECHGNDHLHMSWGWSLSYVNQRPSQAIIFIWKLKVETGFQWRFLVAL